MEKKKFATEEIAKCGDKSEVTGVTELYDDALNDVIGGNISFLDFLAGYAWCNKCNTKYSRSAGHTCSKK